jgi:hypothetical protein
MKRLLIPLSMEDLRGMQAKFKGVEHVEIRVLLWEIFRLHIQLRRMHQLSRTQQPWTGVMDGLWQQLRADLNFEPSIQASEAARGEILAGPNEGKVKRKAASEFPDDLD